MKRADNPILQWLIAEDVRLYELGLRPGSAYWSGRRVLTNEILDVCRWLDAEDEWVDTLPPDFEIPSVTAWRAWKLARMAEAGAL